MRHCPLQCVWLGVSRQRNGAVLSCAVGAVTGATAGLFAFLVDIDILAQLVSIGTLCIFCFVCAAVLARRYAPAEGARRTQVLGCGFFAHNPQSEKTSHCSLNQPCVLAAPSEPWMRRSTWGGNRSADRDRVHVRDARGHTQRICHPRRRIGGIGLCSFVFSGMGVVLQHVPYAFAVACPALIGAVVCAASLAWLPQVHRPRKFAVPLVPWVPALGMMATIQLIASLGVVAWVRFLVYYALCTGLYAWYRGGSPRGAAFEKLEEEGEEGAGLGCARLRRLLPAVMQACSRSSVVARGAERKTRRRNERAVCVRAQGRCGDGTSAVRVLLEGGRDGASSQGHDSGGGSSGRRCRRGRREHGGDAEHRRSGQRGWDDRRGIVHRGCGVGRQQRLACRGRVDGGGRRLACGAASPAP